MGRYISTGIIYQYGFEKSSIPGIESPGVKQQIVDQLFPEIYGIQEDENYLYFGMSGDVSVNDLFSVMNYYYDLRGGLDDVEREEFERVKDLLKGKNINDAYELSKQKPSYLYYSEELGFSFLYFGVPLVINGERKRYPVHVWCIAIDSSSAKTITEDDLLSYEFFTELLRYRMKSLKLADAMLIYLSP